MPVYNKAVSDKIREFVKYLDEHKVVYKIQYPEMIGKHYDYSGKTVNTSFIWKSQ